MSGIASASLLPACTGDGREIVTALLGELGLAEDKVETLETVPYAELVKAYMKVSPAIAMKGGYIGGAPLVNDYYKGNPLDFGLREHAHTIPLMVGSVFGEFSFAPTPYNKKELTKVEMESIIGEIYKERTQEMMEAFVAAYPDKNPVDLLNIDRAMRQPSKQLANLHAQKGNAGTYLYEFTLEFPFMHDKIAWHCSDIPFFFHNTDRVEICGMPGVSDVLEEQIFGAFMAFVRGGQPDCEKLPEWPAVTADREPTMIFDRKCEVRINFDDSLYALIDSILPPFNLMEIMASQNVQH